jgi:hypothetical protein
MNLHFGKKPEFINEVSGALPRRRYTMLAALAWSVACACAQSRFVFTITADSHLDEHTAVNFTNTR